MLKIKNKLIILVLIFCIIDLLIVYVANSKKFLSEVNTVSKNGVTMRIDHLIMTDDRLAVSVVGSRDDGDYIGAYTWGRGSKWDWYGLDESVLNNYGEIPSLKTKEISWCFISPYNIISDPAYGTFKVNDLTYQNPSNYKWIVSYKGSWELCFPLSQTDTTIDKPINQEVSIDDIKINVNSLRFDVLGATLDVTFNSPISNEFINDFIGELEIKYVDGSSVLLELSQVSRLDINTVQNTELNYIVTLDLNAPTDQFRIIDVENINDILLNGTSILN